jgi:zinc transport system substrate-binding protein
MNKKLLYCMFVLFLGVTFTFSGCNKTSTRKKNMVSVSIAPIRYFVDRLTDHALQVNVMVPQGASHGTYSPTASQMQQLSDSRIYFRIGSLGYEQAFIHRLRDLNAEMIEVNLADHVELIRGETIDHGDHVHEGGIDPHIWLSPEVMLKLLPVIRDNLIAAFPELEELIQSNYPALLADMEIMHQEMQELVETLTHTSFLIFHPALTYLARDYGMRQVSIEHEGKEPSPGRLSRLIRDARAENIPIIFIQEEYDVRNAQLVAQETGARVVPLNHLAYQWFDNMEELMNVFKENLR